MTDKRVGIRIDVGVQGQQDLQNLDKDLDSLGQSATGAGKAAAAGGQGAQQLGAAARQAGAAAGEAATGIGRLGTEAGQAGKAAAASGQGAQQLGTAARQAGASAGEAATGISRMGTAAEQAEDRLGATRRGLQSISTQLQQTQQHVTGLRDMLLAGFSFQQFVQAAAQMEQVQAGLAAVARNGAVAGEQMAFVRRMANAAGVDVADAGKAFLGLAAATKGTAVEGEPARQVFEAVTLAMAKAGKSSAETQNALLALSQMASKGTVQMEELRGQLGEALPGALQAAASGMGVTTKDLIDLVENGRVAAEDLFPALTKGLNELYGSAPAAQTLSQEITNIKNSFVEMSADLGQAGGLQFLKAGAEGAQMAIFLLGDALLQTGQRIGVLAAAVATLDFSGVSAAFQQIEQEAQQRLIKAAAHNDTFRAALKLSGDQATLTALQVNASVDAYEKAVGAVDKAGGSFIQLSVAFAKARKEAEDQVSLADKEVQAVKAHGEAAVARAKLLNDEAAVRQAVSKAAADEAKAVEHLAATKEGELNLLKIELAERTKAIAVGGQVSDQRKKDLEELQKLVAEKQVDVDKTTAQAAIAREHAKAQSEAVLAARAHREAIEQLNNARGNEARAVLTGLQAQKEVARQAEEMAKLMGDEHKAREARILQLEIEIKIVKARAEVAKVEAEGTIAVAQAKIAEAKASGTLTPAKEAELNASIKLAEAKIKEAKAMGQGTEVLEKQLEALRSGTAGTNNLAAANKNLATEVDKATAALMKQNAAQEAAIAAQEKELELKERQTALENKKKGVDAQGFAVDKSGQRIAGSIYTPPPDESGDYEWIAMLNQNAAGGEWRMSAAGARRRAEAAQTAMAKAFRATGTALPTDARGQPADLTVGPAPDAVLQWLLANGYTRTGAAADGAAAAVARQRSETSSGSSASTSTASAATSVSQSSSKTITLRLDGGASTTLSVGSDKDAAALEGFLSQLEFAARTSSR